MSRVHSADGFTLIEILVVVLIISLLATLVGVGVIGQWHDSQEDIARAQAEGLEDSVKAFKLDVGRIPTAAEGLDALLPPGPPNARNYNPDGYVDDAEEGLPLDPWHNAYQYQTDGRTFAIISYGPDGVASDDDISSRTPRR